MISSLVLIRRCVLKIIDGSLEQTRIFMYLFSGHRKVVNKNLGRLLQVPFGALILRADHGFGAAC